MQSKSGARTVGRQAHQDLIDEMRDRMNTPEAKALYAYEPARSSDGSRARRPFADSKGSRSNPERAEAQVGLTTLAHNLLPSTSSEQRPETQKPQENA